MDLEPLPGELSFDSYRRILETAQDAIVVVGPEGRIVFVNAQTKKMFGYARAELLGRHVSVLIPERFRQGHDGHMARFFTASAALGPMGRERELFGRRKDGTELSMEVSVSPVEGEGALMMSAAIRDITERRRIETRANLLASAVESSQDAFALFDENKRLVLCNSVCRRLIADSLPGPIVGKLYEQLLDEWMGGIDFPDEAERVAFRAERLTPRRNDQSMTFDLRMRDGRSLRVIDRCTAEGGIAMTIWDLTKDARLAEELRETRIVADAASSAKSSFLASMSHELRTPLNAILGFAQLLQRDKKEPLSDRHKARVDQILKGGEHLLRLINDILDLSHIEAGGLSISTEPVDVADVVNQVERTLEPIAAQHGIALALGPLSTDLPMVAADRTRFVQILMNFGANAIKYNRPSGKVSFATSAPDTERIRVTVRDSGMGVPLEQQHKLFFPFQRAGQETGPIEGTGIGLVISKRLATLMQGEVGFRSTPGEGSEFWVDLPVHASGARSIATPAVLEASACRFKDGRRLVLYVEDHPANVRFMTDLLSTIENIDLLTASTAERGVELARERRPDVIIMDINLPGMSGLDALRTLRELTVTKAIPVIALTAAASERDRQRGEDAGFYKYLTKPVQVDEFLTALEPLLVSPHA